MPDLEEQPENPDNQMLSSSSIGGATTVPEDLGTKDYQSQPASKRPNNPGALEGEIEDIYQKLERYKQLSLEAKTLRLEMLDAVEHSVVADNDLAFFVDAFSRVKLDVNNIRARLHQLTSDRPNKKSRRLPKNKRPTHAMAADATVAASAPSEQTVAFRSLLKSSAGSVALRSINFAMDRYLK